MTMKLLIICTVITLSLSEPTPNVTEDGLVEWELFKITNAKAYKTEEEEKKRLAIFLCNLKFVREQNEKYKRGEESYDVTINGVSDLTDEEFASYSRGYNMRKGERTLRGEVFVEPEGDLPTTVDWRLKGAVTLVKDQKQCESCYSFSAVGSLEGQWFLKTGQLVSLSEQNIIDCSGPEGDGACHGGLMNYAFQYVIDNKGIDTEAAYPYTAKSGTCKYATSGKGATATSFVELPSGDELKLQAAVAKIGPISVAIDSRGLDRYSTGVLKINNCSTKDLDHGVVVVGYGTTVKGEPYWLLKNSWGISWGMQGYFMMARNNNNMCGIATEASYPKV